VVEFCDMIFSLQNVEASTLADVAIIVSPEAIDLSAFLSNKYCSR
jgi:hypothetical protein